MNIYKCSPAAYACCPDAKICGPGSVYCSGSWCESFNDSVTRLAASGTESLADIVKAFELEED